MGGFSRHTKRLIVAALATLSAAPLVAAGSLTPGDRIACRRAIEQVMWAHREWPAQNPDPKPGLDDVLPPERLRGRVEDDLRKSDALRRAYQYSVSEEQLQGELDRMARDSRDPDLLRELFAALGNDPRLAAECVARPAVTDRMIRTLFAHDETRTEPVRARAEAALAEAGIAGAGEARRLMDAGEVVELNRYEPAGPDEESDPYRPRMIQVEDGPAAGSRMQEWSLSQSAWSQRVISLATQFGVPIPLAGQGQAPGGQVTDAILANLPVGTPSALREEDQSYSVRVVLSRETGASVEVATIRWMKPAFEDWWGEHRMEFDPHTSSIGDSDTGQVGEGEGRVTEGIHLPVITATPCTDDTWFSLPWSGPLARSGHLAVWTGTEMIIWGGMFGGFATDTPSGGRYDPATDTWTPLPLNPGVPVGVTEFSMTWTGTEVFVYGGTNSFDGPQYDGGLYNPQTNLWTAMLTPPPGVRFDHTVIWTGTELILWGGFDGLSAGLNTGWRLNPSTMIWTPTSTGAGVPAGRGRHTAVWTNGRMLIWGGLNTGILGDGAAYNPTTDSWTQLSNSGAPSPREYHAAVWTGTYMVVWGGNDFVTGFKTGGRYRPLNNSWTPTSTGANSPSARSNHTAVWTGTEMIIWGGGSSTGARYNPTTDTWAAVSTVNAPASGSAVWTGSEMIVWGGGTNYGARYSPTTNTWTPMGSAVPNAPAADFGGTTIWTGAEVIVWGGTHIIYVPATNSWVVPSTQGSPGVVHWNTSVWTGKEMISWGGNLSQVGGRYNPMTDTWTQTIQFGAPSGRSNHTAVWTGREMIVWGGEDSGVPLGTGGRYDPLTDSWQPTSTGPGVPSPRHDHVTAWSGKEMLIWGGIGTQGRLGDGSRYDPISDTWQPITNSGAPSPRQLATSVWTGDRMIVWGGFNPGAGQFGYLNDGGLYDPMDDSWTPTGTSPGVPSGRNEHVAVWTGIEMLVWGGDGIDQQPSHINFDPLSTGGRYSPTAGQWTPTSLSSGAHLSSIYPYSVWTGKEMFLFSGLFDSGQGAAVIDSGSLYCAGPCTTPTEPPVLSVAYYAPTQSAVMTWTWPSGASSFDVLRGDLASLSASGGNFTVATDQCIGQRIPFNGASDASIPAAGDGFWYLVRAQACMAGSYDDGTQVGSRDVEIAASGAACP